MKVTHKSNSSNDLMSFQEIGEKLGISHQYARIIYHNGMFKLKRLLAKKGIDEKEFQWYINYKNR